MKVSKIFSRTPKATPESIEANLVQARAVVANAAMSLRAAALAGEESEEDTGAYAKAEQVHEAAVRRVRQLEHALAEARSREDQQRAAAEEQARKQKAREIERTKAELREAVEAFDAVLPTLAATAGRVLDARSTLTALVGPEGASRLALRKLGDMIAPVVNAAILEAPNATRVGLSDAALSNLSQYLPPQ